jgi:Transposase Tn5 dimerisation domain/Transposase DNA-binding
MNDPGLEHELATLDLGDVRLDRRARRVLQRCFESPQASLTAAQANWAEMMGAYRLFAHEQCTDQALLQAHAVAVLERVRQHPGVLVIQDTTELDYSHHPALEGTGPLAAEQRQGFFLHTQWVVNEQRLPLGTWQAQINARELTDGDPNRRKHLPLEQKESYRWLKGYRAACELVAQAPGVQVISMGDRENDLYEIYVDWQQRRQENRPAADWLIRCNQDRVLQDDPAHPLVPEVDARLLAQLAQQPVLGGVRFTIQSKAQWKKVHGGHRQATFRQGRTVRQEIRVAQVTPRPPRRPDATLPAVTFGGVMATEIDPPPGQEPIHWVLLTSLPVHDLAQALRVLQLYLARWEIEVFHRVLKSGCRIEQLQFTEASRLKPAIALYLIVAWRILFLMKLGREVPDLSGEVVFADFEWKPLWIIVRQQPLPPRPPRLGELIGMIGQLGGHPGRRGDGPPGPQALWRGLQQVHAFAQAWQAFGPERS